jgi:hypothetical protein
VGQALHRIPGRAGYITIRCIFSIVHQIDRLPHRSGRPATVFRCHRQRFRRLATDVLIGNRSLTAVLIGNRRVTNMLIANRRAAAGRPAGRYVVNPAGHRRSGDR